MIEQTKAAGKHFWDWVDGRAVVRRIVLGFTLFMTFYSFVEMVKFAYNSPYPGMETAAIIAAVLVPITSLQGFAFKHYTAGRSEG